MNKAILILLATTIGMGLVSLHLVRELRSERANVQSLQTRIGELERMTATSPPVFEPPPPMADMPVAPAQPIVPLHPAATVAKMAATDSSSSQLPRMPTHEERMRMMREGAERQRALMKDPEYREGMRMQFKMMQSRNFPDLAGELDISAEQADQLLTLLAEQQIRAQENAPPFLDGQPDPAALEEMRRKGQQTQEANEAELANLLGAQKMQEWKDYQKTMGTRHQVKQLSATFAAKGAPLPDAQARQLVQALAAEQQRSMKEMGNALYAGGSFRAYPGGTMPSGNSMLEMQEKQLEQLAQQNKRVRDAVAGVLSPEQLRIFEEEQNSQLQMQQAMIRMARAQAEAEARGEIAVQTPMNGAALQAIGPVPR